MTLTKYHCMICGRVTDQQPEYECDTEQILDDICDECKEAVQFAKEVKELCKKMMVDNIRDSERLIGVKIGYCPVCGTMLSNKTDDITRFCKRCGQAVKWE